MTCGVHGFRCLLVDHTTGYIATALPWSSTPNELNRIVDVVHRTSHRMSRINASCSVYKQRIRRLSLDHAATLMSVQWQGPLQATELQTDGHPRSDTESAAVRSTIVRCLRRVLITDQADSSAGDGRAGDLEERHVRTRCGGGGVIRENYFSSLVIESGLFATSAAILTGGRSSCSGASHRTMRQVRARDCTVLPDGAVVRGGSPVHRIRCRSSDHRARVSHVAVARRATDATNGQP